MARTPQWDALHDVSVALGDPLEPCNREVTGMLAITLYTAGDTPTVIHGSHYRTLTVTVGGYVTSAEELYDLLRSRVLDEEDPLTAFTLEGYEELDSGTDLSE